MAWERNRCQFFVWSFILIYFRSDKSLSTQPKSVYFRFVFLQSRYLDSVNSTSSGKRLKMPAIIRDNEGKKIVELVNEKTNANENAFFRLNFIHEILKVNNLLIESDSDVASRYALRLGKLISGADIKSSFLMFTSYLLNDSGF